LPATRQSPSQIGRSSSPSPRPVESEGKFSGITGSQRGRLGME
jgi:hypothetical protein